MNRRAALFGAGLVLVAGALAWVLFVALPRSGNKAAPAPAATAGTPSAATGRKIKARLFYVAESGTQLASVEREVAYGEGAVEQAKAIVMAAIALPALPSVSPVPQGTTLRALFIKDKTAFVDVSRELVTAHPGGSTNELLTIYAIVNALTTNLPVVTSVQILVDGKQVDTLAGHVDLRRPFVKNLAYVE